MCEKRHALPTWRGQPLDRPRQKIFCEKRVQCETAEQSAFANNLIEKPGKTARFEARYFAAAAKLHAMRRLWYSPAK